MRKKEMALAVFFNLLHWTYIILMCGGRIFGNFGSDAIQKMTDIVPLVLLITYIGTFLYLNNRMQRQAFLFYS